MKLLIVLISVILVNANSQTNPEETAGLFEGDIAGIVLNWN